MSTVLKVTYRERAAAQLRLELDKHDGRVTDPRIVAMANARLPVLAPGDAPVIGRDADAAELVAVFDEQRPVHGTRGAEALPELTAEVRRSVLDMIARGRPLAEIAVVLGVPPPTPRARGSAILRRLRRGSRAAVPDPQVWPPSPDKEPIRMRRSD